ncbi:MAG: hypothetical protein IPM64_06220 [Phycisphaerales bacterium]|nr:hypothetical protein [Phycisphaerales bacterium]
MPRRLSACSVARAAFTCPDPAGNPAAFNRSAHAAAASTARSRCLLSSSLALRVASSSLCCSATNELTA